MDANTSSASGEIRPPSSPLSTRVPDNDDNNNQLDEETSSHQSDIVSIVDTIGSGKNRRNSKSSHASNSMRSTSGSGVTSNAGRMAPSDFRAQVRAEEERVMAEFGILSAPTAEISAVGAAQTVPGTGSIVLPASVGGDANKSTSSIQIPMIGDVFDMSDDLSTLGGFEVGSGTGDGTTTTGDIQATQSEWVSRFGGGQMYPEPHQPQETQPSLPKSTSPNASDKQQGEDVDGTNSPTVGTPQKSIPTGSSGMETEDWSHSVSASPGLRLMAGKWNAVPEVSDIGEESASSVNTSSSVSRRNMGTPNSRQQQLQQLLSSNTLGADGSASTLQGTNLLQDSSVELLPAFSTHETQDPLEPGGALSLTKGGWKMPPKGYHEESSSVGTNSSVDKRKDGNILLDLADHNDPDEQYPLSVPVMGISPLASGGWALPSGRHNAAYGSQSSLAVSESEASSNFDETANNNFPSSILGSAGTAPAALMATSNWANTKEEIFTPRSKGSRHQYPHVQDFQWHAEESNEVIDYGEYNTPDGKPTIISEVDVAGTSGVSESGLVESDYDDGHVADDEKKRKYRRGLVMNVEVQIPDSSATDSEYESDYKKEKDSQANIHDKPYNKSVRGPSARLKYGNISSPRAHDGGISSNSSTASRESGAAVDPNIDRANEPNASIVKESHNSDDDEVAPNNRMYALPYTIATGSVQAVANLEADSSGNEFRRTTSYGSEGLAEGSDSQRTQQTESYSEDDKEDNGSMPSASTTTNASVLDDSYDAMNLGDSVGTAGIASASTGTTQLIHNLPAQQGTGGLYHISSNAEMESLNNSASLIEDSFDGTGPVASPGTGGGFNVAQIISSEEKQRQKVAAVSQNKNEVDQVGKKYMKKEASEGDLKPLGMIIVGKSLLGEGNDTDEDVSLLKGFKSVASDNGENSTSPGAVLTADSGSKLKKDTNSGEVDDEDEETNATSIWHQRVCGIRIDRLILILGLIVLLALAIVIGSVVAQERKQKEEITSASQNQGVETEPPFGTPSRSPFNLRPTLSSVPMPVGMPIAIVPSVGCVDSLTAEFFGGLGEGAVNCTWLSTRPEEAELLCVPGEAAFIECLVTCNNCEGLTSGPTVPTTTTGNTAPSATSPETPPIASTEGSTSPDAAAPNASSPNTPTAGSIAPEATAPSANLPDTPTIVSTGSPVTAPASTPSETEPSSEPPVIVPIASPTETEATTSSPTLDNIIPIDDDLTFTQSDIEKTIRDNPFVSESALNDISSPQGQALEWIERSFEDGVYDVETFSIRRLLSLFALATFAYSVQTNEWMIENGWLNEPNECDWNGLVCDRNGTVVEMNLTDNDLEGMMPEEIGILQSLTVFDVSTNVIHGSIPNSIGNLVNLQQLNLDRNAFSGNLPISMDKLVNLESLTMERNLDLAGPFPPSMGKISTLRTLNFYYTGITGAVPLSMCAFLTELVIDCRQVDSDCWTRCFYRCGGSTGVDC